MTKASHDKRRSDLDGRLADALLKFDRCRRELLEINDELAGSNAEKAERIADAQLKAEDVSAINTALARANAHAADLMAEIEQSRGELERKNEDLARANASAAELMAELDAKREALDEQNAELSKANAHAAELMAEIDAKRDPILFGVIDGKRKLYFVGEWEDEYCNLTLDQMADVLGREVAVSVESDPYMGA